ncbi:MAG: GerMN domain-containing protein [Pseudoflavonifractor sp.]|nr:GerMN domain-containing protein [Pseudoflavonifractor sp.]
MRRENWLAALTLAVALLCTGCGGSQTADVPPDGQYSVYFISGQGSPASGALAHEFRTLPPGKGAVEGLLRLLLAGPASSSLTSPFPRGTTLRSWRVDGDQVVADLSESYGGLSGVDLSLADGCIALTLCQLEGVHSVYLTVEGRPRPFRDRVLRASDLLLENSQEGPSDLEATLWFPSEAGLAQETRTLHLAMGDDPAIAALQALLAGPETSGLWAICPEGTKLLSLDRDGAQFTVNLSGQWLEGKEDPAYLYAVADTLSELEPEAGVTFQVEGEVLKRFGGIDLSQPLSSNLPKDGNMAS